MDNIHSSHDHHGHSHDTKENSKLGYILTIVGTLVFIVAIILKKDFHTISLALYITSYILIGYDILINALKGLFSKNMFDENFLMSLATIGAFFIGEYTEGVAVLLFYKVGEFLQHRAVENSRKKISSLLDIRSEYANLKIGDNIEIVEPSTLKIDDIILVKAGEKIPVDGVIIEGNTELNMSALTGESIPKSVKKSDEVMSGSINMTKVIIVKVTKLFEDSTISKIIEMVEHATEKKSDTEKYITRFARVYTPIVTGIALLIALLPIIGLNMSFTESLHRAFTFLVISCPCALVISVPLGFFVGIGACSKRGVLVKGSNYLDMLNKVDTIVFDKTGTLTKGVFEITKIETVSDFNKDQVLEYITLCEEYSNHYIARSIVNKYSKEIDKSRIKNYEEIAGQGIKANIDEKEVLVGNYKIMESSNIKIEEQDVIGTIIYLAVDKEAKGYIVLEDEIKEDASKLIRELKRLNINKTVMLTGDSIQIAQKVANSLSIDEVYANLLPKDKVIKFEQIRAQMDKDKKIAYVGDGINDSPVIAMSDIGIAMGKGSDIAIETSDIVLMNDEPSKLLDGIRVARKTNHIVLQNIYFAIIIKVLFLILSGFGYITMWLAIFADVGVAIITVINAMRIFNIKERN